MTARKQTTIRLSDELAQQAETVARVRGVSVNTFFVEAIAAEIDRARSSKAFSDRARALRKRDKEILRKPAR
jgi:predicted transcriptional regulator